MEHLHHQWKKPKSEHRVMEYLNRMLKVKNSIFKTEKRLKDVKRVRRSFKTPKRYYSPYLRIYYEGYGSIK